MLKDIEQKSTESKRSGKELWNVAAVDNLKNKVLFYKFKRVYKSFKNYLSTYRV